MDNKIIKYPIYIVSKGRWQNPITAKYFLRENIHFKIIIEPQELDLYKTTIERYKNIAVSGYNYTYFVTTGTKHPFYYNTHVYSGMLINNKIPFRWRLKYNEDIDLCLQALHNKWNTILLNAYVIRKVSTTAKLKGGNQEELYLNNATEKKILKVKSLETIWPQYIESVIRFNRPHHYVNWKKHFKQTLVKIQPA